MGLALIRSRPDGQRKARETICEEWRWQGRDKISMEANRQSEALMRGGMATISNEWIRRGMDALRGGFDLRREETPRKRLEMFRNGIAIK